LLSIPVPPPLAALAGWSERPDRLWALSETKRLEDNEFVIVSFWGGLIVVHHRHAYVEEDQGEGGQAGRENVA
jgi:hypothetical protein